MVKSIYEIFDSKAIAAYWTNVNANMDDPYIGQQFFPIAKQTGLELAWIKGKNNLPVALQPSAFDTKATLRDRIGVTELSTEMPFFREAARIGEKDRQNIETLLAKGEKFAEPTILRIFNDVSNLVEGGRVQAERMRMSLLYSGTIDITATAETGRDVNYHYEYDADGTFATDNVTTLTTTAKWNSENVATMDPLQDLLDAKQTMLEKYGVRVTRVLMNSKTLKDMLASEKLAKYINPVGYANAYASSAQRKAYIEQETGLTIITYDKMFKNEQGQDVKFYPDGYVTLLPSYVLGNTWYGTTPEEFDLMSGTDASVSVVNTGIAITTIKEAHPVNVQTIVSEIVLPSFERISDIYIIKVNV